MKWTDILKLLIGLSIIVLLVYHIGFRDVYLTLVSMNLFYLPIIFVLFFLSFVSGALSLKMLTMPLKVNIPIRRLYGYSILIWALGLFAPGRIGDLSLIYFLKRERIELGQATFITIADRFIALIVLSALSIVGFFSFFETEEALKLISLLVALLLSISFWIFSEKGRYILKRYILGGYSVKFKGFSKILNHYLKNHKKIFLVNFFIILIRWIVLSTIILITFVSFGFEVPFILIVFISAMTTILALLPVTMAGLGIREAGAVFLYAKIGVPPSITMGVYIVLDVLNYVVAIGSITILADRLKLPKIKNLV